MPQLDFVASVPIVQSGRVQQLLGIFDVPPTKQSENRWKIDLPIEDIDWQIGLIVGPSGSGKSTVAKQAFADAIVAGYEWPQDRSIVDAFPQGMSIKEITGALSSVGFSSPPSWLRPFHCLSNGEQFRATLARALVDPRQLVLVDEFTSVVDRTVAQIGSAAVSKAIRRIPKKQFIAATCHYDVADWLDPDWVLEMPSGTFTRRLLRRRPAIELEVRRVHSSAWELFKRYHYLTGSHHKAATCFCAFIGERPVAFCSVIHFPHPVRSGWKEHRTVVLPDFQGVGIGNTLSEYVGSLFAATGKPYRDNTAHPSHCHHRAKSRLWKVMSRMKLQSVSKTRNQKVSKLKKTNAVDRLTMSFEYIGPTNREAARKFGLL